MDRVIIQWTGTADSTLGKLPKSARRGLLDRANKLFDSVLTHKPLTGPLGDYQYICFSRYRAPYRIEQQVLANGDSLTTIIILFVATGNHGEAGREQIYRFAERLLQDFEPPLDCEEDKGQ